MDKAHEIIDDKLIDIEKRLKILYSSALPDVEEKAKNFFADFFEEDEALKSKVMSGAITEESYIEWRKKNIMIGNGFSALKEDIAEKLLSVNEIAIAYINDELPEVYSIGYNALEKVVEGVNGYSFALTDANTIKNLVMNGEKSLLPLKSVNAQKDIRWNMKNINSQVLQGIVRGESIPKIAKRIRNVEEMNRDSSIRTARTIVTSAENKGRQDSYEKAEADGIILQKKWLSSNQPGRTRDWHFPNGFESITVDQDKPFVNGYGEIMYPGDPSAHPANVYNCRCSMAAVVKGFKKAQVEKATNEMSVEKTSTSVFVPAKTREDAIAYTERFVTSVKSKYSGNIDFGNMDVSVINDVNRALHDVFDAYDLPPLRNISVMNMREKRWRESNAEAAYSYLSNELYLNGKWYKNAKTIASHQKEYDDLLQGVFPKLQKAIDALGDKQDYTSSKKRVLWSAMLESGRTNVNTVDTYGTIIHEMGHALDSGILKLQQTRSTFDIKGSMQKYGSKISGYAVESTLEYVAESFAAYWKGETNIIDPELLKMFKKYRK